MNEISRGVQARDRPDQCCLDSPDGLHQSRHPAVARGLHQDSTGKMVIASLHGLARAACIAVAGLSLGLSLALLLVCVPSVKEIKLYLATKNKRMPGSRLGGNFWRPLFGDFVSGFSKDSSEELTRRHA